MYKNSAFKWNTPVLQLLAKCYLSWLKYRWETHCIQAITTSKSIHIIANLKFQNDTSWLIYFVFLYIFRSEIIEKVDTQVSWTQSSIHKIIARMHIKRPVRPVPHRNTHTDALK
jgi:hypothetical protein